MKRAVAALALLALLAGCHRRTRERRREAERGRSEGAFRVLAGSELKDVEQRLADVIERGTGVRLRFTYAGTLETPERLASGEQFDALWVSHGKYLAMDDRLKTRIVAQEKTMLSPVILGLRQSKARALGWDNQEPTWQEIADAARAGKFTFGMTNPASSNTGLTAMIGLAAALAPNPEHLTEADMRNPRVADFFHGQSLTSGSSGWLAEAYERDQSRVDGLVNYESVLLSLNANGKLREPLTLVYPREGIITADYPLMLLNARRRADYDRLITFLRSKDFQTRLSAVTLRRPVNPDATVAAAIPKRTLVELSFPAQPQVISKLLETFLGDVRVPGSSRYVLDVSGSMRGERLEGLKSAMLLLASNGALGTERFARFQNREEVGVIPFSEAPEATARFEMGDNAGQNEKAREGVAAMIRPLEAHGPTALYASLEQALAELGAERAQTNEKRYYTVVLMTDGKNNRAPKRDDFAEWYRGQGDRVRGIPVFPILFGEGDEGDLRDVAELTGGRLFDSRQTPLPVVFREIRGYQ